MSDQGDGRLKSGHAATRVPVGTTHNANTSISKNLLSSSIPKHRSALPHTHAFKMTKSTYLHHPIPPLIALKFYTPDITLGDPLLTIEWTSTRTARLDLATGFARILRQVDLHM
jgi:hypothetical protein